MVQTVSIRYTVSQDGWRIAYTKNGNGFPFVLLPQPVNDFTEMWRRESHRSFFEALCTRFSVVQYDGRGCGSSQRELADHLSFANFDDDLRAVLSECDTQPSLLFAPQTFGHAAIRYAVEHADRVAALILWQPLPSYADSDGNFLLHTAAADWERAKVLLAQAFWPGEALEEALQLADHACNQADFIRTIKAWSPSSVEELLPALRVPVLLLYKTKAFKRTVEIAHHMASAIPDSRLVFLADDEDFYGYPRDCRQLVAEIDAFVASVDAMRPGEKASLGGRTSSPYLQLLTPRETEVLRLIATGSSNKEIARQLGLSDRTVARHITNLYSKLRISSKSEATALAIRSSLV